MNGSFETRIWREFVMNETDLHGFLVSGHQNGFGKASGETGDDVSRDEAHFGKSLAEVDVGVLGGGKSGGHTGDIEDHEWGESPVEGEEPPGEASECAVGVLPALDERLALPFDRVQLLLGLGELEGERDADLNRPADASGDAVDQDVSDGEFLLLGVS